MTTPSHLRNLLLSSAIALTATLGVAMADDTPPPSTTAPSNTTPPTPPAGQNAPPDAEKPDPRDAVVCKKEPPATGSRIGAKKVCRTVREWGEIQAEAREVTEDLQRNKAPDVVR